MGQTRSKWKFDSLRLRIIISIYPINYASSKLRQYFSYAWQQPSCFAHNAEHGSMYAFGGPQGSGYSYCRGGILLKNSFIFIYANIKFYLKPYSGNTCRLKTISYIQEKDWYRNIGKSALTSFEVLIDLMKSFHKLQPLTFIQICFWFCWPLSETFQTFLHFVIVVASSVWLELILSENHLVPS